MNSDDDVSISDEGSDKSPTEQCEHIVCVNCDCFNVYDKDEDKMPTHCVDCGFELPRSNSPKSINKSDTTANDDKPIFINFASLYEGVKPGIIDGPIDDIRRDVAIVAIGSDKNKQFTIRV